MADTSNEKKLSLKVMVDTKAKKVVFAEADKEFVDFIFNLISLPLSTVTKVLLLNEKSMVGSVGTLYKSIESLNSRFFESDVNSRSVLMPRPSITVPLLSLHDCFIHRSTSDARGACVCYSEPQMSSKPIPETITTPGYVNRGAVFIVMDNLEVQPLSIAFIKSHVKNIYELEEDHVQVGLDEGLEILKASLQTNSVLTTAFSDKLWPLCQQDLSQYIRVDRGSIILL